MPRPVIYENLETWSDKFPIPLTGVYFRSTDLGELRVSTEITCRRTLRKTGEFFYNCYTNFRQGYQGLKESELTIATQYEYKQVMTFTKDCHGRRRGDLVQSSDYRVDLKTLKITHYRIPQCKNEWVKKEYLEDISIPTRRATATWPYDYKFTNQGYLPDMANRQKPKVKESEKTIQGKNGVRKKAKK